MEKKIQVYHYIPGFQFGGIETRILELFKYFDKEKYQFHIVLFENDTDVIPKTNVGEEIQLHTIAPMKLNKIFKHIKDLKSLMSEKNIDIAHCYSPQSGLFFLFYAKKMGVKRRIMHARTSSFEGSSNITLKNIIKKISVKYSNIRLAVSEISGNWLFGDNNYEIIPNAIDLNKYSYSKKSRNLIKEQYKLEKSFIIGHVGRNTFAKNHKFLIEVFKEILDEIPNAKLMLVGFGKEAENIISLCDIYKISENVLFCGYQSILSPFYSAMDYMIFPSHYEGLPGTLIEAQATGLRCLVSDTITKEVDITEEITFYSLDKSPKEWAKYVINNQYYTRRDNKIKIYEAGFSTENSADITMGIYERSYENETK